MSDEEPEPTRDPDDPSGLPEEEQDINPMGVNDDDQDDPGEAQPGIPTEGEPEIPS